MTENDHDRPIYCYKYVPPSEGSLKIISDGTLKFTSVLEFNDPFDSRPYISPESLSNLHKTRPDLLKAAADTLGLSPAQRLARRDVMIANLRRKVESGDYLGDLLASFGVVCLSRVALDILMWSHYADFHRGFVVEFRIPTFGIRSDLNRVAALLVPQTVKYQDDRPCIDLGDNMHAGHLEAMLLTKSTHWRYEQEERVIGHERPPGIYPYERTRLLESVIAGMRISADTYSRLEALVARAGQECERPVKLYRAMERPDKFQLWVPGHPRANAEASA